MFMVWCQLAVCTRSVYVRSFELMSVFLMCFCALVFLWTLLQNQSDFVADHEHFQLVVSEDQETAVWPWPVVTLPTCIMCHFNQDTVSLTFHLWCPSRSSFLPINLHLPPLTPCSWPFSWDLSTHHRQIQLGSECPSVQDLCPWTYQTNVLGFNLCEFWPSKGELERPSFCMTQVSLTFHP